MFTLDIPSDIPVLNETLNNKGLSNLTKQYLISDYTQKIRINTKIIYKKNSCLLTYIKMVVPPVEQEKQVFVIIKQFLN